MTFREGDRCECGAVFHGRGFSHFPECPLSSATRDRREARQRHPATPRPGRGPHRIVGNRVWEEHEEIWVDRRDWYW